MNYVRFFDEISLKDLPVVGGKNASLGEMVQQLAPKGILIPNGFALTAQAYWHFVEANGMRQQLTDLMRGVGKGKDLKKLKNNAQKARELFERGTMPDDLAAQIIAAYKKLSKQYKLTACDVAVRSSATAEDLPTASFAGQQETYLNIHGEKQLIESCKRCMGSLFTDRAIFYRIEQGIDHIKVALSVGVQKMVRSDRACAGVAFSLDTETGFKDVIVINASYGLGETVVKGVVTPDEYMVHKQTLEKKFSPIIKKRLGDKFIKLIYTSSSKKPTKYMHVPRTERSHFALKDDEILALSRMVLTIENHYSRLKKSWEPMDVEWAKDGVDDNIYIVQARPETVHAHSGSSASFATYVLKRNQKKMVIASGQSIGQKIVSGKVRIIKKVSEIDQLKDGEILVTQMTDPDWVPVMKKAAGIITQQGGRTCHAAIVSRELGIPAIVGALDVLKLVKNGQTITIDCSQGQTGYIYSGALAYEKKLVNVQKIPNLGSKIMINIAEPDTVFSLAHLPVQGVGLARTEFIIANAIGIHPMAFVHTERIKDKKTKQAIKERAQAYSDSKSFFVDTLAQGVGMIAAAFYPKPVVVRFSDFKSNEYRNLMGGIYFEEHEENPMLGFRGASRYVHERYKDAFALECAAMKKVREDMGFSNVILMVPFVRTVQEGKKVVESMRQHGLEQGRNDLKVIMMCEIPSNVLLMDQFSSVFDGFSIGSNDLTQLVLGVDRDSALVAHLFDERNGAVVAMMESAIKGAHKSKRPIGICGQAPSDYPDIARKLIELKIDSISLNHDAVMPFLLGMSKKKSK